MIIKETVLENVRLTNVELIIPMVTFDYIKKAQNKNRNDMQKNVEMPDWKYKIFPYKIMIPTATSKENPSRENLFRWPKYQFHNEDLVSAYNIGDKLKWNGVQKAVIEKKPDQKKDLKEKLMGQETF